MRVLPVLVALLMVVVLAPQPGKALAESESKPYVAWGVGVGVEGVKLGVPFAYHTLGSNPAPLDAPPSVQFTLPRSAHAVSILIEDKASGTVGWGVCILWDTGARCKDGTMSRVDGVEGELTSVFPAGARVDVYVWNVATDPARSLVGIGTTGTATMFYD